MFNFWKPTKWTQGIMKSFGGLILCRCQQRHREVLLLVFLLILSLAFFVSSCFCLLLVSQCFCWRPAPEGWSSGSKKNSTEVPTFSSVGSYGLLALGYLAKQKYIPENLLSRATSTLSASVSTSEYLEILENNCQCVVLSLSAQLFLTSGHKI